MLSSSVRLAGAAPELLKRAALTTRCRSCAASRPQENASLFISIAAPLRSIAFMIASSDRGIAPRWNAKPSMKALVAMLSPISAVARQALDMGGHAEHRADGDDPGAADAGDEDVVGAIERRRGRQRQIGEQRRRVGRRAIGLPQFAAMHGDKARAKALDAGKVLIAVRLVDPPLATEFGFQRLHRDAVGNGRAVAAAFADALIDEDALRRIRIEPALAAATLFRRAGLVVDQDGEALDLAQFLLHRVEFAAVMNGRAYWEVIAGIFF